MRQVVLDHGVDGGGIVFFRELEDAPASRRRDICQNALSVPLHALLRPALPTAGISPARIATAGIPSRVAAGIPSRITTTRITAPGVPPSRIAAALVRITFLVHFLLFLVRLPLHIDGINDRAGPLSGVDGGAQRLLAALVDAVGEEHQHLAAVLLARDLIRGQIDRIVEQRLRALGRWVVAGIGLRRVQQTGALPQPVLIGRQILQQLHLTIEMDDESTILRRLHHCRDEVRAGGLLLRRRTALAAAGVYQEAEDKRLPGRWSKRQDALRSAVFAYGELVLGGTCDRLALLLEYQHRHRHHHRALRRRWRGRCIGFGLGQ